MKKKQKVVALSVLLILFAGGLYLFYSPIPILASEDIDGALIGRFSVNLGGTDLVEISLYNEKELIEYLSTCRIRRSLFATRSHRMDDYQLEIMLHYPRGGKQILLGDKNLCSEFTIIKYKVLNADEVLNTILGDIDIEQNTKIYRQKQKELEDFLQKRQEGNNTGSPIP